MLLLGAKYTAIKWGSRL